MEDSITFLLEAEICQPGTRTSAVEDGGALEGRVLEQRRTVEAMEKMGGDLLGLLEEGDYSDVIIQCEGRHFKCHKAILSSRSPVFRAMFQHKSMLEQQKNVLDLCLVKLNVCSVEEDRCAGSGYPGLVCCNGGENAQVRL